MSTMPAAFLGHGNPMNALEHNRYTEAWSSFAHEAPRPSAVLAVSAHWYVNRTAVTAMAMPRTIHDFTGFPQALFDVDYPAPGSPEVAREVARALSPIDVELDEESWGLDHGTWSLLVHLYPEADVPVLQLSIDASLAIEDYVALGRALAPLRQEGVMIIASGNVVHNLSVIDWRALGRGAPWAERFDAKVHAVMQSDPTELAGLTGDPDFSMAVPTPEHFVPLAYFAGLADASDGAVHTLVSGCELGSLSMTSYALRS
jgi:4,5-DOPA dioxygenase extradiol